MWRRKPSSLNNRTNSTSQFGDLSSTTTTNEEFDSNDDDETRGDMELSNSKVLIVAKSPQNQFHNHEAQTANMKDTIKYLQHQLDIATDRIANFAFEKGEIPTGHRGRVLDSDEALNDSIGRKLREVQFKNNLEVALRNVTAQAAVMLTERRDLHRELQCTKAVTLATETMMNEQVITSLNQKKNILLKLKAIKSIIVFEDRSAEEEDEDEDLDALADDSNGTSARCFCLPSMLLCWPPPIEDATSKSEKSTTEAEKQIEMSDNEILDEMNHLYLSVNRKLEECSNNAATDLGEIESLREVIRENKLKITKRGHEIEALKGQLEETKAHTALMMRQQSESGKYHSKDRSRLHGEGMGSGAGSGAGSHDAAYERHDGRPTAEHDQDYSASSSEARHKKNRSEHSFGAVNGD